jgi:thiamine kinase-like enzyme
MLKVNFKLTAENAISYLQESGKMPVDKPTAVLIEPLFGKNTNFRIKWSSGESWAIKQENIRDSGKVNGDFRAESLWRDMVTGDDHFSELLPWLQLPFSFDWENHICLIEFLDDWIDLDSAYGKDLQRLDDLVMAANLGKFLGKLHSLTYDRHDYREKVLEIHSDLNQSLIDTVEDFGFLSPRSYARLSKEALFFFQLLNRAPKMRQTLIEFTTTLQSTCLLHGDIRWPNFLTRRIADERQLNLKAIDWELMGWGDPILDLGACIACYLKLWIDNLPLESSTDLAVVLQGDRCPISAVKPSIKALLKAYLETAPTPELIDDRRLCASAATTLLERAISSLFKTRRFTAFDLAELEISRKLLCQPEVTSTLIWDKLPDI